MASPKTWTIVNFIEDNSVEAVPTKWINGTRCLWPLLPPEKLGVAIRKLDFNSHWPDSPVRVLRNATFDDYVTARAKARKAEDFSDLNSTDGDEANDKRENKKEKRRRLKKRVLSSEEADNCSDDDEPIQKKMKSLKSLPPPPVWVEVEEEPEGTLSGSNTFNMPMEDLGSSEAYLMSPKLNQENSLKTNIEKDAVKKPTSKISANDNTNCACSSAILFNIQNILVDIKATVDKLAGRNIRSEECKMDILKKSKINFPISSEEDFEAMERFLGEEENYSALVSFFSKMGGHSLYEFIKRCIGPLLSDNVAIHYSYIGRKGKKRFDKMALSKAILESAEIANIAKNKKETEVNISVWLRKATERKSRLDAKNNN